MKYGVLFLLLAFSSRGQAQFVLRDVGLIGLMSHDIFAWDHKAERNVENGRLDLSTIFEYENGSRWEKGGNPKNSENAPVYSLTMELVDYYKARLELPETPVEARQSTVRYFHELLRECYVRGMGEELPSVMVDAFPGNIEQAALRGLHDLLPGRIQLYDRPLRRELDLTNFLFAKTRLNTREMDQPLKPFDGDYDEEYKKIRIPFRKTTLNLKEIDRKFIEKFSPYKQSEMLEQLALVGRGEKPLTEVFFIHHLRDLFLKAMCSRGNPWMPAEARCEPARSSIAFSFKMRKTAEDQHDVPTASFSFWLP